MLYLNFRQFIYIWFNIIIFYILSKIFLFPSSARGTMMAKVQIGGQMPPLPNSDDMAERYGIEANHRPAAALSCSRVWRATRSRHAALDRLKLRAHCQGRLHLYFAPIGLAVFVDHLFGVTIPGASINPARSFGPALVAWDWGALDILGRSRRRRRPGGLGLPVRVS